MSQMSAKEFAEKVSWEGGVDGALDYGLTIDDLTDEAKAGHPELVTAWAAATEAHKALTAADDIIEALLEE